MTGFRSTLPGDEAAAREVARAAQRLCRMTTPSTRDECMAEFGAAFAAARRRRDERYAAGGAQAVAEAAHVPGGPSVAELAAGYEQLAQQARQRQEAA